MKAIKTFLLVGAMLMMADFAFAQTWTRTSASTNLYWSAIACSADGTKLVASSSDGVRYHAIWVSTNSGASWSETSASNTNDWWWVASSADGTKLVAANAQLVAGDYVGSIFTSTNSGATWQSVASFPDSFYAVAFSADGEKLIAASSAGYVLTSTNSGATWTSNSVPGEDHSYWHSFVSSADGNTLVTALGSEVASDAGDGSILISTNSGATWNWADAPIEVWNGFACSADGCKLVGSANHSRYRDVGGIYTAQIIPTPQLGLTPANGSLKLSWLIPSTNFVMQQSSDLASWSDVTNAPVLNLTNLQNELVLSPTNSSGFYRLKTP